jgi:hypothetical protein
MMMVKNLVTEGENQSVEEVPEVNMNTNVG